MTSALDSHFGMAKQSVKGTPITANASFKYFYFTQGTGISPVSQILPTDQEIGAGPLVREVSKVGVNTAGGAEFIPRPDSLGLMLLGALGYASVATGATYNTHTFKLATDQFSLPYFTLRRRSVVGGDVASDVRVASLNFNFTAANFARAQVGFLGAGSPTFVADPSVWSASTYLDTTEPLLTCKGTMQFPTGTALKALRASVTIANNMPTQEQRILGSYTLDDIELVSRAIAMTFVIKADATLYEQMMYDPDQSGDWDPSILNEAAMTMQFQSAGYAGGTQPYQLSFHLNGRTQAQGDANVAWSVQPINLQGNRQVLMAITGIVKADTFGATDGPFSAQLINTTASY